MNEILKILIAGAIVLVVGYPLVTIYSKWKKAMKEEEEKNESEDE